MRRLTSHLLLLLPLGGILFCASCSSNAELKKEQEEHNAAYKSFQERRGIRQQAREERSDMAFDRIMGHPTGETGLKHPGQSPDDHTPAPLPPLPQ